MTDEPVEPTDDAAEPMAQAGVVPYRRTGQEIEICIITSTGRGRWGLPKGIVDPGETPPQSALKEAQEEAGLSGAIEGPPLGAYDDFKWDRPLRIEMFLMRVDAVAADWPEAGIRQRVWVAASEALRRIANREQRRLVEVALRRLMQA